MNMNLLELDSVVNENWQTYAIIDHQIKSELCLEQGRGVSIETKENLVLCPKYTAFSEARVPKYKMQPKLFVRIERLPVVTKAEPDINFNQLSNCSSEGEDSNPYLIEETENEVNFSLKSHVKSGPTASGSDAGETINQLQNSKFRINTSKEEYFDEMKCLIPEEIHIISEDEGGDQTDTRSSAVENKKGLHSEEPPVLKYFKCIYQTYGEKCMSTHALTDCSYRSSKKPVIKQHQTELTRHLLTHKKSEEITYKVNLKDSHMKIHIKDQPTYKCTLCSYTSTKKGNLQLHLKNVHRPKDTPLISCPEEGCSYKTRVQMYLANHTRLSHKYKKIFKCFKCPFETKYAQCFKAHALRHEDPDKWFSCPLCMYKTPNKYNLTRHALVHKEDTLRQVGKS